MRRRKAMIGVLGEKWMEGYGDDHPGMMYPARSDADDISPGDVHKRHALRGWRECGCGADVHWRREPMSQLCTFAVESEDGRRWEGAVFMMGDSVDEKMICAAAAAEALHAHECGGAGVDLGADGEDEHPLEQA